MWLCVAVCVCVITVAILVFVRLVCGLSCLTLLFFHLSTACVGYDIGNTAAYGQLKRMISALLIYLKRKPEVSTAHVDIFNVCLACLQIFTDFSRRLSKSIRSLLCVSCPSANEFSAKLVLLLARSNSNSPRSLEGSRRNFVSFKFDSG